MLFNGKYELVKEECGLRTITKLSPYGQVMGTYKTLVDVFRRKKRDGTYQYKIVERGYY